MDTLVELLNYDIVQVIKKHTKDIIYNDCESLLANYRKCLESIPHEPSGGREYIVWVHRMTAYTEEMYDIKQQLQYVYKTILNTTDFDEINQKYTLFKQLITEATQITTKYFPPPSATEQNRVHWTQCMYPPGI